MNDVRRTPHRAEIIRRQGQKVLFYRCKEVGQLGDSEICCEEVGEETPRKEGDGQIPIGTEEGCGEEKDFYSRGEESASRTVAKEGEARRDHAKTTSTSTSSSAAATAAAAARHPYRLGAAE